MLDAAARSAGLGVRGKGEAVGEDDRAGAVAGFRRGRAILGGGRAGRSATGGEAAKVVARRQRGADPFHAAGQPDLLQGGDVPALGGVDRDRHRARARAADPAADEQQPGGEEPRRAAVLHRLEERQVHQAGRVVK